MEGVKAVNALSTMVVPLILLLAGAWGAVQKIDVFDALVTGAKEGFGILKKIAPTMIALLTAIAMLRASGALTGAAVALGPLFRLLGIPPECIPLTLLRPFSGGGALAIGAELISHYGSESLIGRTAAVMLGSTETTFFVIGIYFGATGVKKGRYVLIAALLADLTGFIAASWTVRMFFG